MKKQYTSTITIDKHFKDSFSFNKNRDYSWYLVVDETGHVENTLGDSIPGKDTAHLYFTANFSANHQG